MINVANIPLSLYIHVPWCVKKCPYCDFNSHTLTDEVNFHHYVDALIMDVTEQASWVQGRVVQSIFIGGGTPSLLPIVGFKRLFTTLYQQLTLADDCEITLEANPATIEHAPFVDYLQLGINRLSLGVQSFADSKLQVLGRIHTAKQATIAIRQARQAGFTRLNVDLMHGLPRQTANQAVADIETAIDNGATHLSWYQLTIEPNTVFYRQTPVLPSEDNLIAIQQAGEQCLTQAGFSQYEVSAWTKAAPCQHNLNYWQFGDYLAIGAGAHAKLTLADNNFANLPAGIYRFSNSRLPKDYLSQTPPKRVDFNPIVDNELPFEFMLNALRLKQGVPVDYFSSRTGLNQLIIEEKIMELQHQGLLVSSDQTLQCTPLGLTFLNTVIQRFL